jgi:sialic acid synthase SpsE/sugar phosphate isomerase/epimerase
MIINKSIQNFIIFEEDTVFDCLRKIEKNKQGTVFVLDYTGVISGVITDGDLRRWFTLSDNPDLSNLASLAMNTNYVSRKINDSQELIHATLSDQIKIIPLLNSNKQLEAVVINGNLSIEIGEYVLSEDSPCFVIAEVGNNHNGDISLAKQLVDLAVDSGADCVKFQMRDLNSLYKNQGNKNDYSADLGAQYTLDLLSRFQLSNEELFEVFDYCKSIGILSLCTPWDLHSLSVLEDYGMDAYKVASADLTNIELLEAIARTGRPMICSTGMSTEDEIERAAGFLNKLNAQFIFLHCNSTYPAPYRDVNLLYMKRLKSISNRKIVGYSGHERGYIVPILAVGLGAKVIEKHFTIDKTLEGNDHKVSLLPSEFREMVDQIRLTEEVLGGDGERTISQGEYLNREVLAKSLVINQPLRAGCVITRDIIDIKSPGQGLQPYHIDNLIGKIAQHDFSPGDFFHESDLNEILVSCRNYSFNRPFGIPVRYHDFENLILDTNVDFVEFHLSYKDLEIDIDKIFEGVYEIGFNVHSPELFSGDHILNLCSSDKNYLDKSLSELQKVVDITIKLKRYFPLTEKPLIIINAGGFSAAGFLPTEDKKEMYKKVASSLDCIESEGVELIIQTMPPFPWHFGGQSHHNLFVSPDEIMDFCKMFGYRICLDVSHSQMACNYYHWSMNDFIYKVAPYVEYLHIVDALGVDGEGVQIGEGDVDFSKLAEKLDKLIQNAAFIPEIWQGHKQQGSGFWQALEFLEEYL